MMEKLFPFFAFFFLLPLGSLSYISIAPSTSRVLAIYKIFVKKTQHEKKISLTQKLN